MNKLWLTILQWMQNRCVHPPHRVTFDLNEGDKPGTNLAWCWTRAAWDWGEGEDMTRKEALKAYLLSCVEAGDWHGVRDAAVDIEVEEAREKPVELKENTSWLGECFKCGYAWMFESKFVNLGQIPPCPKCDNREVQARQ